MIDARTKHRPELAPALIEKGIIAAGTQTELAERIGVTSEYLRQLKRAGSKKMSYQVQVCLEQVIKAATTPNP